MQCFKQTGGWALVVALAAPALASAEQVTLQFRLVTQEIHETSLDAPTGEGRSVGLSQSVGTALFEDGRIAHKTFVVLSDDGTESGDFTGYSSYVFENGDRLNLRFTGGWSPDGAGGDYEVLSGTGGFANVTGTGRFDAAGADWEGATLFDGEFTLDLPGS